jgi:hypothetical protein
MQMNSRRGAGVPARERQNATLPQAVFQDKIARRRGQHKRSSGAKSDKQIGIGLLQMWKPSAISVFAEG